MLCLCLLQRDNFLSAWHLLANILQRVASLLILSSHCIFSAFFWWGSWTKSEDVFPQARWKVCCTRVLLNVHVKIPKYLRMEKEWGCFAGCLRKIQRHIPLHHNRLSYANDCIQCASRTEKHCFCDYCNPGRIFLCKQNFNSVLKMISFCVQALDG